MSLVLDVPVDRLATTLAPLRGPRTDPSTALAPLPLRVAPAGDGTYEVLDGFKRLARWRREGHTHVPVVVEDATGVVGKGRLLEANSPRRTVSALDEARVVRSHSDHDHLSPTQIAKATGRGRAWVDRRLTLGRHLASELAQHLDHGRLSATTAHSLASFPRGEQTRLAESIVRYALRTREAEAFLAAWRVASDPATREALVRDPGRGIPEPRESAVSPLGPTARELQARFSQTERALDELAHLDLSGFTDPERRVLQAGQRRLAAHVIQLARTFHQENPDHADPRGTLRTAATAPRAHPDPGHRPAPEPRRQDHPSRARPLTLPQPTDSVAFEARSLPRPDHGAISAGAALSENPARDPGASA
jgi:ParB-like chromosome segregation protein Spo0J